MRGWDNLNGTPDIGPWSDPTPWASMGGGFTSWASDSNGYQPDGFEIRLEVQDRNVTNYWHFCSPLNKCEHGFGDCDTDNDCRAGTTYQDNVGHQYGYIYNDTDVCVGT